MTLPPGVRRHGTGYQAYVRIHGQLYTQHFPAGTGLDEMLSWRQHRKAKAVLGMEDQQVGAFASDCRRYLQAVQGMPTYQDRAYRIDQWRIALGGAKDRHLITSAEIRRVLEHWKRGGLSHGSLNLRRTALLHLWTVLDGKSAPNPVKDVPRYREIQIPLRLPTITQAEAAIAGIQKVGFTRGAKSRARLRVLLWTGWPPAQLMKLQPEDVDWQGQTAYLSGRQKGRGVRGRRLPLLPQALSALQEFDAAEAWGRFSVQSLRKRLHDGCQRARPQVKPFRVYDLRHLFLTTIALTAKDDRVVAELAMHADIRQTRRYTEQSVDPRLTEALARVAGATFAGPSRPVEAPQGQNRRSPESCASAGKPARKVGGR